MLKSKNDDIMEKLEYIGLNLDRIPKILTNSEPLNFRIPKFYDDKQYRQYKYIPVKEIQILITNVNKSESLLERYKAALPLHKYLDRKKEENIVNHTAFLSMLNNVDINKIKIIEEEQDKLNKNIPYKVKFENNHLWQIYYSESVDKYFMLVSAQDLNNAPLFYVIKKQLEKSRTAKIFVPIKNLGYTNEILNKQQIEDLENYMWLFTRDWPFMYEVFDKNNELSLQIIGQTQVYNKITSKYKIILEDKTAANRLYKLLKVMFIAQTELPNYFKVKTEISKNGELEFYIGTKKMEYEDIIEWISEEYNAGIENSKQIKDLIDKNTAKLEDLKAQAAMKEIEYLAKEKQISTFLECKKSFFGKVKYFFKYSKKSNKNIKNSNEDQNEVENQDNGNSNEVAEIKHRIIKNKKITSKNRCTLEELLQLYKEIERKENELKNIIMDINALKLKNKNTDKKIENATLFIQEIENHKKSIFEFWRYTNKDEMGSLPEGEKEDENVIRKIERTFDYEEDLEKFGKMMDKIQRKNLSKEEVDAIYIADTDIVNILNKMKNDKINPRELDSYLRNLKEQALEEKTYSTLDDIDIFGGIASGTTKTSKIKNKEHRENARDRFNILDISKNTTHLAFELRLEQVSECIKRALNKSILSEDVIAYIAIEEEDLDKNKINVFNMNPENEMTEILKREANTINLYKIHLQRGINAISYTNYVYYDNQNKTLPIGQDISSKIIFDVSKLKLELKQKETFRVLQFEDDKNDFSELRIKNVNVFEYKIK